MGDQDVPPSLRDERATARSNASTSSSNAPIEISPNSTTEEQVNTQEPPTQVDMNQLFRTVEIGLRESMVFMMAELRTELRQEAAYLQTQGNLQTPLPGITGRYISSSQRDIRDLQASGHSANSASSESSARSNTYMQHTPDDEDSQTVLDHVNPKMYKTTSEDTFKTVRAIKITGTSVDINRKIESFKSALDISRLSTMLDGRRLCPVQTTSNPNGYSPRSVGILNDPASIQDSDDFFHYYHDLRRLFQLVSLFFDETLYYHCTEEVKRGDGIQMYNKIICRVNGKALRDIDAAQTSLDQFKINSNRPLPAELSRLDDVIMKLEHAQQSLITDTTKKNILCKLILKDPRQILHTHVTFAHHADLTYDLFRDGFCSIYDNLPASFQTVKMAAMKDAPETPSPKPQICFNHQKGICTRGRKCKYSHDLPISTPPAAEKVNHRKGAPNKNNNPRRNAKEFDYSNIPMNDRFKKEVGTPTGIPALNNQHGYSRAQKFKIKTLLSFTSEDNTPTQWCEPEEYLNAFRMSGITYPSDDTTETASDHLIIDAEIPSQPVDIITSTTFESPISKRFRHNPTPQKAIFLSTFAKITEKMNQIDKKTNIMVASEFDEGPTEQSYVFYVSEHNRKIPGRPFLKIFGWQSNTILARALGDEHGMSNPSKHVMILIHHLGVVMFNATIIPRIESFSSASSVSQSRTAMYQTFNPICEPEYCGTKEMYVSAFTSISDYQVELLCIENNSVLSNAAKNFLMYVLIYDFMSYVSKRIKGMRVLDENNIPNPILSEERLNMLSEAFHMIDPTTPIYHAFRAIIMDILPADPLLVEPAVLLTLDPVPADLIYEYQSTNTYATPVSSKTSTSIPTPDLQSPPPIRLIRIYNNVLDSPPAITEPVEHISVLIQQKIGKIATIKRPAQILDTGATVCGAGENTPLENIQVCHGVNVQGAFGKGFQPKERGTILDMQLECLVIPGMTDTLISISAACKKGHTFIFDDHGCHGYTTDSVRSDVRTMKESGLEIIRGELRDGLYHMISVPDKIMKMKSTPIHVPPPPIHVSPPPVPPPTARVPLPPLPVSHPVKEAILYTNAQPASKFEHVHHSLGHPGKHGMQWHRTHTPGADYTTEDANKPRGLCRGCVEGGMRQASTDHLRQHRPPPTRPGQQFSIDAFTCTTKSRAGNLYCDILVDHYSRKHYTIFTRNRTASELVEKASILFDLHPEWNTPHTDRSLSINFGDVEPHDSRFIRLDAESNYSSTEFLHWAAMRGLRLERVPPRNKHANGTAERAVGGLTLTTNVIMLTPNPPVPLCFWDLAMDYAADTLSFCYSKAIQTSPYVLLNRQPVPFKFLQPFWTPCYVYFGQKN